MNEVEKKIAIKFLQDIENLIAENANMIFNKKTLKSVLEAQAKAQALREFLTEEK